ncbi:MAG: hypothetical protein QOE51_1528 [Actinoplanes sp.]|jgi:hypothetical protein|nr:hypothetical protein [Actinoplanes sp.]
MSAQPDPAVADANLIRFLETGAVADKLFAPDVFADLSLPHCSPSPRMRAARMLNGLPRGLVQELDRQEQAARLALRSSSPKVCWLRLTAPATGARNRALDIPRSRRWPWFGPPWTADQAGLLIVTGRP